MYFKELWNEFSKLNEVEAIALGGSRAGNNYDEKSDYDLYIYCTQIPDESTRRNILVKCCSYMEIGNSFWKLEDDCTLKDGVDIDILYRNIEAFTNDVSYVVEKFNAYNGYTTCMWHNLLHSRILYDTDDKFRKMQERFDIPYPDKLKDNIISKNMRLLTGNLPSYDMQIKKALKRGDMVSVNHRTAAFMESYFDIIFALNKLTHPGEKRMVQYAIQDAEILPEDFEKNIEDLFTNMYTDSNAFVETLEKIIDSLKKIEMEC